MCAVGSHSKPSQDDASIWELDVGIQAKAKNVMVYTINECFEGVDCGVWNVQHDRNCFKLSNPQSFSPGAHKSLCKDESQVLSGIPRRRLLRTCTGTAIFEVLRRCGLLRVVHKKKKDLKSVAGPCKWPYTHTYTLGRTHITITRILIVPTNMCVVSNNRRRRAAP